LTGQSDEVPEEFEGVLSSIESIDEHLNLILLLRSDEVVSTKNYQEAARIQFLKRIEVAYDIKPLDVALETTGSLEMGDAIFNLFKRLFRTAKKKPTTFQELRQLYVAIIKQHL